MFVCILAVLLPLAIADNLVLYYPVHPGIPVPVYEQNFEKNAPPRIWSREPDVPSAGIIHLIKGANKLSEVDWKGHPVFERQQNEEEGHKNEPESAISRIEPTTLANKSIMVSPGRTSHTVVPTAVTFPHEQFQFVDVVDGDIDYSAYDTDKSGNTIYDDSSASLTGEIGKNERQVKQIDRDTEMIGSNFEENSESSMIPLAKKDLAKGSQTFEKPVRDLQSKLSDGEVTRPSEAPTSGLRQQHAHTVRVLNVGRALQPHSTAAKEQHIVSRLYSSDRFTNL